MNFNNLAVFVQPIEEGQMIVDILQAIHVGNVKRPTVIRSMRINYPTLRHTADFLKPLKEFFLHPGFWTTSEIESFQGFLL
jgi:hypothetical protein